ncbi:MAG TPA: hypothetical protein VGQ99_22525 [Tepidisphaeraceae bacterium]|jgi:hypothetical protein|nr:hypothetical protein [Tepidisphaeraceae bacterium]
MKTLVRSVLIVLVLAMIGCDPDQVVIWSADGSKAVVIGTDGLHLCDPAGKLTPLLVKDVRKAAWFGDSSHIVAAREMKVASWKEAAKYLEPERIKRLEVEGEKLFKEMMAQPDPLDEWASRLIGSAEGPGYGDFVGMVLYIGDRHADELKKRMTEEEWKKLQDGEGASIMVIQMYEVGGNEAKEGLMLASTFSKITELRPSPNGKVLGYVVGEGEKELCAVYVVPTDGTAQPRKVADLCARFVDWSADGRYLAYARANPPKALVEDTLRLGTLRRMQVCEADGNLKAQGIEDEVKKVKGADGNIQTTPSPAESLAGIIFNEWTKVRYLRDGRIVFVSGEVSLPVASDDTPTKLSLFSIDPVRQATVTRLFSRRVEGEVGDAMQHFEINPDQTSVAIPGSDGRMTVVSLNGGKVTEVVRAEGKKLFMAPSWRTSDELCFAIGNKADPQNQNQRPAEVYLWRPGGETRCISKEWPEEVVAVLKQN